MVTLGNDIIESGWFIYNNGTFELPFPFDMQHVGGPSINIPAMNNLDQAVVIRHGNSDDALNGIFLFDDGMFFEIGLPFMVDNLPTTWDVRALTDDQQLAGQFTTSNCPTSDPFQCIRVTRGFIATPR